nr:type VI secretion system tube protein Hcp [Paraburkholderia sp. MM5384-R2]
MWLKDDGGADIKGSATVQGREGSIEIIGFSHGVNLPADNKRGTREAILPDRATTPL